jgi:MFS family permease
VSSFWLGVAVVAFLGCTNSVAGIGSQSLVQTLVEDELRGRVMGLWIVIGLGGVSVGGLLVGSVSRVVGLSTTTLGAGVACTVLALTLSRRFFSAGAATPSRSADAEHRGQAAAPAGSDRRSL